jgi:hypothetical protein
MAGRLFLWASGMRKLPPPVSPIVRDFWSAGTVRAGSRTLAEETPVAFTYDGATHALMMATPDDLTISPPASA